MNVPQLAPPKHQPKPKHADQIFWIILIFTIVLTLALIGLVIWLFKTQNLNQVSTWMSIIASIATTVSVPLIFFFTVFKRPEKERQAIIIPPTPPLTSYTDLSTMPERKCEVESPSKIWHVPYRPNRFFTGREQLLTTLHNNLTTNKASALTQALAINGLGGIGKTQVAIEYAYRHRNDYHYIFWANAATRETLIADYVTIAHLLHLPEQNDQDQNIIVLAVKRWFTTHNNCLLILDNVDELNIVDSFLPTMNTCHLLITTRIQATNAIAQPLEVEKMDVQEGVLMLLRRTNILPPETPLDRTKQENKEIAEKIVLAMDGLPLALDQAGAYIVETGCSLSVYLDRYQNYRRELLQERGQFSPDHPASVMLDRERVGRGGRFRRPR